MTAQAASIAIAKIVIDFFTRVLLWSSSSTKEMPAGEIPQRASEPRTYECLEVELRAETPHARRLELRDAVAGAARRLILQNDDVALLTAYYVSLTGDTSLATNNIKLIDATMAHNVRVGDPNTGIAYNSQDTATTYDHMKDCLHNYAPNAGNLYYQGLKEATGYRAAAYLDGFVSENANAPTWTNAAAIAARSPTTRVEGRRSPA